MLATFARLVRPGEDGQARIERAALVINIREGEFLSGFDHELESMKQKGLRVFILFLEASDEVLQRRFSETRRPHPADAGGGLMKAIGDEREAP
jgi:RNase adapter protein RapZ